MPRELLWRYLRSFAGKRTYDAGFPNQSISGRLVPGDPNGRRGNQLLDLHGLRDGWLAFKPVNQLTIREHDRPEGLAFIVRVLAPRITMTLVTETGLRRPRPARCAARVASKRSSRLI
jgi:hypothetical protein